MTPAGDHHDRAPRGPLAGTKARQNVPSPNRQLRTKERLGLHEEVAHGAGVSEEKQHTVDAAISRLELHSSHESLGIARRRLALDAEQPIRAADRAIPSALIAWHGQRNLGGPPEDRVEYGPKVSQQLGLRRVAQWVRARIEPAYKVEPDHGRESRQRDEWHVRRSGPFDPADLCVRDA
jgi:hypothetical protein